MTSQSPNLDQDAEPPTPDAEEPGATGIDTDDPTPARHPDPEPDADEQGADD